ncbi:hypothetical protein BcDW1_10413 [Botrytis cinerea BcDW1]|uniref:DUF7918 domain-containing protein n=1 Tax=Botryotinia fuckeliana (strain BcDW1) TaxID=1290391 RepID=M7UC37_BOTF1|nr:hypothetical protein BcDW1_10413 [Botrytis cinerea BcDW1]
MAILKESGNEYEVQIVNAVTGQSFKEYVKLGDREKPEDREAERYITSYPGIMFKIQITLKTGFCFKPFDAVEANLYFKGQSSDCSLAVLNDPYPDHKCTKKDLRMEIACVNMSNYGKNLIGAPLVFKELQIDEKLSGQTDVVGVNPVDLGSFYVRLNRRKIAAMPNNYLSRDTATALWNAEKVDKMSFKKHGITNSIGLGQNRISTQESVVSSYKFHTSDFLTFHFTYRNLGKYSLPLTKEQSDFERGVLKENFSDLPAYRPAVLYNDGTAQQFTHPRKVAEIKRKAQGSPNAIKREMKTSYEVSNRNSKSKIIHENQIKEGSNLNHVNLPSDEPLAKRQKIAQEPTYVNTVDNVKIQKEPIDVRTLDDKTMVLTKEAALKYNLTELVDAVVQLKPSSPGADLEVSIYWEMAEEILRQTVAEFVRIRR